MAWHRIGDKPLSDSMVTQFNDAYSASTIQLKIKYMYMEKGSGYLPLSRLES